MIAAVLPLLWTWDLCVDPFEASTSIPRVFELFKIGSSKFPPKLRSNAPPNSKQFVWSANVVKLSEVLVFGAAVGFSACKHHSTKLESSLEAIRSRKWTLYLLRHRYFAGKTSHPRFKCPAPPRQGSNSPPPGHGRRSTLRRLPGKMLKHYAFRLALTFLR